MSGGKDSTTVFHIASVVAKERGRLPLKVFWLDQEAEWRGTVDYMKTIMYRPDVQPFWFQIPFRLTSSLSHTNDFFNAWDPAIPELWIHEQDPISIKTNPLTMPRESKKGLKSQWDYIQQNIHPFCGVAGKQHVGVLVGLRMVESPVRRLQFTAGYASYKNIKWSRKLMAGNTRTFWPIYDFADRDVWICIARNDLPYNRVYDGFFRYGLPRPRMRVSSLIHEISSLHDIPVLQEIEPATYDRFLRRIPGVSSVSHIARDMIPTTLPAVFASWHEYRDYLLEHLIEPQNRQTFLNQWQGWVGGVGDVSEERCRDHVKSLMINDVLATKLHNASVGMDQKPFLARP